MPQPNMLFIQTDQHRYDCIAGHGHPLIRTPNLDRLIREGVTFSHAFCASPVCRPSRASLMTGVWPTRHGVICNENLEATAVLRPGLPTWSEALAAAGYYLGYVGKWQVDQERDPTQFGFEDYISNDGYKAWRKAQGLDPAPRKNGFWGEVDGEITPDQSRLGWGASELIRLLGKASAGDRPFFLRWDTDEPHLPNVVPEPYASMYDPASIAPWPSFGDPLEGKPYIQRQQLRSWGIDGWTWEQWAPIVARYLGDVSLIDAQIGRILDALDALGLAENTLVVYTPDHGDLCGGHGMADKHYVMYDDIARVPLILRWPGVIPAGQACDAFVSSGIDLATTFCDAAGVPQPETFVGQSLLPLVGARSPELVRDSTASEKTNGRPDIFCMYFGNQFGLFSQRMVRDRRWKYVWNLTAEDELYDLEADPAEITNLAARSEAAEPLAHMRRRMLAWLEETRDPILNQWTRRQLAQGAKV
ncbi:MAG: sulfatase-like hydrolase/transferase [Anaerolineae bacterium]|nr:sulfatase-like hydrolase/transferase [Anaerolineae bacterium]